VAHLIVNDSGKNEDDNMKAMTYNIRHGLGNDGKVDLDRIAAIIHDQRSDIVGVQEVDRFWERSGAVDQAETVSQLLDMDWCFGANVVDGETARHGRDREYGTMILSRYPIVTCTNTPFPVHDGWEPRGFLQASIDIPGVGEIRCINTHLQVGKPGVEQQARIQRREQARILADVVTASGCPILVMGDFNAQPGDPELAPLAEQLADAWRKGGNQSPGNTIPTRQDGPGDARIDAIFVSPGFHTYACSIVVNARTRLASDHYPVVANFRFKDGARQTATARISGSRNE